MVNALALYCILYDSDELILYSYRKTEEESLSTSMSGGNNARHFKLQQTVFDSQTKQINCFNYSFDLQNLNIHHN